MSKEHPAAALVHAFHADLSDWFRGTADRAMLWARLSQATGPEMVLVYPSGTRMRGPEFLESIRDLYGRSPGFEATISELEVLVAEVGHAVVAYVESQSGARQSKSHNRRSALAVLVRGEEQWQWRFIQETAIP